MKKFADFRKALSWSTIEGLGFLGSFWGEVIELAEDGDITGWTPEYVSELTGLKTDPQKVWESLARNGWIDERGGRVIVHDWIDTAGTYLRSKYAKDRRDKLVEIWAVHGKSYGNPMGNQLEVGCTVPDLTLPTKPTITPARTKFSKPTAADVTVYASTIGYKLDGQQFCDYYESKGWLVGRAPMKDWRAAVRTWKKNGYNAPASNVMIPKPYKEHRPRPEDLPTAAEVRKLVAGIAKGKEIPK